MSGIIKPLRIVFAGTPEFSVPCLQALIEETKSEMPIEVVGVFTQPDRPAGRGMRLQPSPVKQLALQHQLPIFQPETFRDLEAQQQLADLKPDLFIVVAYGLLLPKAVLDIPKIACVNVHASVLPRWRGAAPITHAILAGDKTTGISLMIMDVGLDTGDVLSIETCSITPEETTKSLHDKLSLLGAKILREWLKNGASLATRTAQKNEEACYAGKINKQDAKIDWQKTAEEIERHIRAFNPWPVAWTELNGESVRIWQAEKMPENFSEKIATPGTILECNAEGIVVATGKGCLRLLQLQWPNAKTQFVKDIWHAKKDELKVGGCFDN